MEIIGEYIGDAPKTKLDRGRSISEASKIKLDYDKASEMREIYRRIYTQR